MQVTRLEIFGFKSFVDRFVLNFDHNFIGIVGPNGCGKSNVVDSLRWVLGETHARHLRGTVLDDLIFTGSDTRRPLGMAEVSITIRPNSGWTQVLARPVEVGNATDTTAALSAEVLNGNGNRALDGSALSAEAAESSDTSASSEQATDRHGSASDGADSDGAEGGAKQNASPELVRGAEAAAAMQVMHDVQELGGKGEVPRPAIFAEIPGLLQAAEIQFTRRLYRSGESEYFINRVPCRLRDMLDIYRVIGLGARGLSIVEQGEIGQFISKKPIERRELLEDAAGISGFRTKMEAAQKKLEKTSDNLARLRDIITEVEKQVRVLSRQAKRARERHELKEELRQYDHDAHVAKLARIQADRQTQLELQERLEAEVEQVRAELARVEAEQGELQAQLETVDVRMADVRREREAFQQQLAAERERLSDLKIELARLTSRREGITSRIEQSQRRTSSNEEAVTRREQRVEELRARLGDLEGKQTGFQQQMERLAEEENSRREQQEELFSREIEYPRQTEIREELERLQAEVDSLADIGAQVTQAEREVREAQQQLDGKQKRVQQERLAVARVESELRSLEAQLDSFAEHVTRAAGAGEFLGSSDGVNRVLLAGIQVPEALQTAVSAVLGEREQFLVTASAFELGERYARHRASNSRDSQPAKFGVIDQGAPALQSFDATSPLAGDESAVAPSARPLLESLVVDESFRPAVQMMLGEYLLVDTLAEALALNEFHRARGTIGRSMVTRSGEVVVPWGFFTTQGKGKAFGFTRRMAELRESLTGLQSTIESADAEVEEGERSLGELRRALTERREARERSMLVERRLHALRREDQELRRQTEQQLREEERRQREALRARERTVEGELRALVGAMAQAKSEIEFELRQVGTLRQENVDLAAERERAEESLGELDREEAAMREQVLAGESEGGNRIAELQSQNADADRRLKEIEDQRSPIRMRLGDISVSVAECRGQSQRLMEQLSRATVQVERANLESQMLSEEFARSYPDAEPVTGEQLEAIRIRASEGLDVFLTEALEEAGRIRRRIEREGEVDPQSIELFEQEDSRLSNLKTQYADLEEASGILSRTIHQLKEISRTRFLHTFHEVKTKFTELIPRLFGGGAGHMELVNPDDPLQSGVEVYVRPPGKKISNMELLSGGEKALVALSVLISMFLHRPSPICVLDEVDAPLDEANLERYLDLITEISKTTQFLVITHNKRTMAQAQKLVGITMQERGVSTALSVRLEESEDVIDQWVANA